MRGFLWRWTRRSLILLFAAVAGFLVLRVVQLESGPPLQAWHTFAPAEPRPAEIDAFDWPAWLAREAAIFEDVRREVTDRLPPEAQAADNRYFSGSPVYPGRFAQDWNRSYTLDPEGPPKGVVVLLHGLTDAPYSLRHVAGRYRAAGWAVVAPRMPGHGTVPAGLAEAEWRDWMAATRLAVREARRRVPAPAPLHIVGFSNGGALAVKYATDALLDASLARPDRLVLFSPMIGITPLARLAWLAEAPALLPRFAKASWLSILPEFNPFKYNSFPAQGAVQSRALTLAVQRDVQRLGRAGRLQAIAPIVTVQSVIDFTVSSRAVLTGLYAWLPQNGSELVLIDRNTASRLGPLLRPALETAVERLVPSPPLPYRLTVIGNATPGNPATVARITDAGTTQAREVPLGIDYPREVFSLSHVAIPFPASDGLYGGAPDPKDDFGIQLGAIATRGETGALVVSQDVLTRMSWNPFFPYLLRLVDEGIAQAR
jgi:alpha-beta hydrolase superfamily lysophospholipase